MVLFADPDPQVLATLEVRLRHHHSAYDLRFATGPEETRAVIDDDPIDIVVVDADLASGDGGGLLDDLRRQRPDVVRVVLSDRVDERCRGRGVAVAQRWLSKPGSSTALVATLADAAGHLASVTDPEDRRALGAIDVLPSHPEIYLALAEAIGAEQARPDQITALAVLDPAASLQLLRWANGLSGPERPVLTVADAVDRIGGSALAAVPSVDDVVRPFTPGETIPGFSIDLFHRHARAVASLAASLTGPNDAELAWTGGLLSGVGLLVGVAQLGQRLDVDYRRADQLGFDLGESERRRGATSRAALGGHLLRLWGLPDELAHVVGASDRMPDLGSSPPLSPVDAVRTARLLAQRLPLARTIGRPHLLALEPDVVEVLDRWTRRLNLSSRFSLRSSASRRSAEHRTP